MEFSPTRDVDSAANDVRDRVSGAVDDLPEEALAPEIRKVDADARPIMFFIISKPGWSRLQLSDYVDRNIADRFSAIDGVARVFIGGEAKPSMRIWLQPERLAAFHLTSADVESALMAQNVELPDGRLESEDQNLTLRAARPFTTEAPFARLEVGLGRDGYLVRLVGVPRLTQRPEAPYQSFQYGSASC